MLCCCKCWSQALGLNHGNLILLCVRRFVFNVQFVKFARNFDIFASMIHFYSILDKVLWLTYMTHYQLCVVIFSKFRQDSSVSSSDGDNLRFRVSASSPIHCWTVQQVSQWLQENDLGQYSRHFAAKSVTGSLLLQMDSTRMKVTHSLSIYVNKCCW